MLGCYAKKTLLVNTIFGKTPPRIKKCAFAVLEREIYTKINSQVVVFTTKLSYLKVVESNSVIITRFSAQETNR